MKRAIVDWLCGAGLIVAIGVVIWFLGTSCPPSHDTAPPPEWVLWLLVVLVVVIVPWRLGHDLRRKP